MAEKQRSLYPDIVKGLAILLVVIGHNIQYGSGAEIYQSEAFFDNKLYQLIYSFHMPLFILVSGYFFYGTISKYSARNIIKSKLKSLLIPILVWSVIPFGMGLLSFDWKQDDLLVRLVKLVLYSVLNNLWFLWGVLFCSGVVLFVNKICKDSFVIYILLWILMIVLPNAGKLFLYEFLYPYFVGAYLFNKYRIVEKCVKMLSNRKMVWTSIGALLICFIALLHFYNRDSYIYISGISVWGENGWSQMLIDLYRWIIGLIGSLLVLLVVYDVQQKCNKVDNLLAYLGRESLGIYIIDIFAANSVLLWTTSALLFSPIVLLCETIIMMIICIIAVWIIKKIPYGNQILFGGR